MSLGANIKIQSDSATPALARFMDQLGPAKLAAKLMPVLREFWQRTLAALPPNRQFPQSSTGFWEQAARSVKGFAQPTGILLTADKQGLRQRLFGGKITARDKALTIPARDEFYGRSAREFTNLKYVQFDSGNGGKVFALVIAEGGTARLNQKGKGVRLKGGKRNEGLVAYWLVPKGRSTRPQKPNPAVMPTEEEFASVALSRLQQELRNN